jgi:hypothetical protein
MRTFTKLMAALLLPLFLASCGSGALDPLGICDKPRTVESDSEFNFTSAVNQTIGSKTVSVSVTCSNNDIYLGAFIDNNQVANTSVFIENSVTFKLTVTPVSQRTAGVYKTTARLRLYGNQAGTDLLKELSFPVTVTIQ